MTPRFLHGARRRGQRGVVLAALLVLLLLGGLWFVLGRVSSSPGDIEIERRALTGKALAEAKKALLGYVTAQAASNANPGRLPCPEPLAYAQDADPANDGIAQPGNCSTPAIGRLPWRTLGLDKLTDGWGEPLWYVVSPGFFTSPGLVINFETPSQLTVDGIGGLAPDDSGGNGANPQGVVALIIAPGPALSVAASASCTAKAQSRSFPASLADVGNYLECQNASPAGGVFVSNGPAGSFNDQVVKLTHQELFDTLEPVIVKRIEKDVVSALKTMYASPAWGTSAANPVYPYARTFGNPATQAASATPFLGSSGIRRGLLPVFHSASNASQITWYTSTFLPSIVATDNAGNLGAPPSCSVTTTVVTCTITYKSKLTVRISAAAQRVARTMRALNAGAISGVGWKNPVNPNLSVSASFISGTTTGAAWVYVEGELATHGGNYSTETVTIPIGVLGDHPITDPANPATGWFVANNWHHLAYYAFSPRFMATQTPPRSCTPGSDCLVLNNDVPANNKRALIILAGRPLVLGTAQQARPSGQLNRYYEDQENRDNDDIYVRPALTKTDNDRVLVIDSN